ncbi:hypothetical protein SAMN04490248_11256 [Salinihabitans flavidus]|uniref:Uncharacterized protein n=1 Tax=Salinihabitans flavidus TaxID=569882 RepID=A0A1H8SIN9_9RHOB|nr:hypothetical protein [Salinihabitans flavidus]SEO78511.1 hypothetical protein SAMN04490248_11256 [Salinihabitans flavidus]
MNRLLALFAFVILGVFLYILASEIGAVDLWVVVIFTALLAGYDFVTSSGKRD